MFRCGGVCALLLSSAALHEFVDRSFLDNKRPPIPGGGWPLELLRKKSSGDLQQIWFLLLKEKNMLQSMKNHYQMNAEELGAWPSPSRLGMVKQSMSNIKQVMQERDYEANDKAIAIFNERLKNGVYRWPPGPQPPPSRPSKASAIRFQMSHRIDEERIRELFGRYDVLESHRGITSVSVDFSEEVMAAREKAERDWVEYRGKLIDYTEYHRANRAGRDDVEEGGVAPSVYDSALVELTPGKFLDMEVEVEKAENGDEVHVLTQLPPSVVAADLQVPSEDDDIQNSIELQDPLKRLRQADRPPEEVVRHRYNYFPRDPVPQPAEKPQRPIHPDEVPTPCLVTIVYDSPDAFNYVNSLNIRRIDGAEVADLTDVSEEVLSKPYAAFCPVFQEAVNEEEAMAETMKNWPHIVPWKGQYRQWSKANVADIIYYNYSNVVDYVEREAVMANVNVWEMPIDVDPSCGGFVSVPPWAEEPEDFWEKHHGLTSVIPKNDKP